jgi:hypothetical protein
MVQRGNGMACLVAGGAATLPCFFFGRSGWSIFIHCAPSLRSPAPIPEVLRLYRARLTDRDVQAIDGARVTAPLQTLLDVIAELQSPKRSWSGPLTRRSGAE